MVVMEISPLLTGGDCVSPQLNSFPTPNERGGVGGGRKGDRGKREGGEGEHTSFCENKARLTICSKRICASNMFGRGNLCCLVSPYLPN